jgi:predicted GIY-YIG superfamily endonuclease
MNADFQRFSDQLPKLMEQLKNSNLIPTNSLQTVPAKGIYVFYENEKPVYVGRSNNIKARIQHHCRPSSGHGSATFAFILAREDADKLGINTKIERKILEVESRFSDLYSKAKTRVSRMHVKAVEIDDPILQTLFEVYAVVDLQTKYNVFDNH